MVIKRTTSQKVTIALDVMGGDNAPFSVIAGAYLAYRRNPKLHFILCGNEKKFGPILKKYPTLSKNCTIKHTKNYISSDEKPSIALRQSKGSSMRLAIEAVKSGEADACVSAGNTGALMAISKLVLRTLDGIDRPAIATMMPNIKGESSVLLDMGANAACDAENLVQFAIMGDAFCKAALDKENPTIGLLNIGSEELKGHETVRVAHQMVQDDYKFLNYHGYVEGDDIMLGTTDVVVTDGFTGNVALKAIEGTAKLCKHVFKEAYKKSIFAAIGFVLSARSLKKAAKRIDPRLHNGAMFLGLNGISIKSHGNADKIGFASAIRVAVNAAKNNINDKIIEELQLSSNNIENNEEHP